MYGLLLPMLAAAVTAAPTPYAVPANLTASSAASTYPFALQLSSSIEGASVDATGDIYCVNQTSFYSLTTGPGVEGKYTFFGAGAPDSHFASSRFTKTLGPFVGDAAGHLVWQFDDGASWSPLFTEARILQPNDMTISGDEKYIYFSGMNYTATTVAGEHGDLWWYDVAAKTAHPVEREVLATAGIHRANGIELSPDDKFLYLTSAANDNNTVVSTQVYKFTIDENGQPGSPALELDLYEALAKNGFTDAQEKGMDPDGMRMDVEGNLFISLNAYQAVLKYNTNTKESAVITLPTVFFPSNLELGGADGKDLVIIGRCDGGETACVDVYKNSAVGRAYSNLQAVSNEDPTSDYPVGSTPSESSPTESSLAESSPTGSSPTESPYPGSSGEGSGSGNGEMTEELHGILSGLYEYLKTIMG